MLPKSLKQWREHQLAPRESERCPASPGVLEPRIAIFQGVTMMQLRNYMEQARVETRGSIKRRPFGFTCRMCLDKQKIHQNPKHRSYSCLRQFAYRWKLLVAMFVIALKSTYYTEWHRWWPLGRCPTSSWSVLDPSFPWPGSLWRAGFHPELLPRSMCPGWPKFVVGLAMAMTTLFN